MFKQTPKAILIVMIFLLAACASPAANVESPQQAADAQGAPVNAPAAEATALPTRAVAVSTSVIADGALALALPTLSLGFENSSKVMLVNVKAGQSVKKGDVLATQDDTSLQDAIVDAQLALKQSEANIKLAAVPATTEELEAAQAALNSAYASYNTTKAGATDSEKESARMSAQSAWLGYLSAQINRDGYCGTSAGTGTPDCQKNEATYGSAYESMLASKDNLAKVLEPVSQDTLTQAYAAVATAQSKLDALKAEQKATQKKIDDLQIAQANAVLQRAQDNLSKATLVSPCDCIVQEVKAVPGTLSSGAAFTLVNLSGLQFKTTNLTERNVAYVKVGSTVSVRLKSYASAFPGKVSAVLAQSSGQLSGVALYTVLITLDATDRMLLPGMTGQAQISTVSQ